MKHSNRQSGMTILELLLSTAVIIILSAATIGYYRSSIIEVSAESTIKTFVADINTARGRAMAGDRGMSWGVRAIPATPTKEGSWEFFGTETVGISSDQFPKEIHVLPSGLSWYEPSSAPLEVVFSPIQGMTTSTSFLLGFDLARFRVNVGSFGDVSVVRSE